MKKKDYLEEFNTQYCNECETELDEEGNCPLCEGLSPCCGAEITDSGLCSECKEHI